MSHSVYVIAEFLPRQNHEQELFELLNNLAAQTLKNEKGCLSYLVTRQVLHPGAQGVSKYKIVSIEEFSDKSAFENHCSASYVIDFVKQYIEPKDTSIVDDFCVRLFSAQ